jgi:NAD+ diphosphatase
MDFDVARSQWTLDRAAHRRADETWLMRQLEHPDSRFLPFWQDHILVSPDSQPQLAVLRGEPARVACALADAVVFLGTGEGGHAWFACDVSSCSEDRLTAFQAESAFRDLGRVMTLLAGLEGPMIAYSRAILHWHRRHRFCGACGSPTMPRQGGHVRTCTNPACRLEHFPRTDPVVIMLVKRFDPDSGAPVCLLARQKKWMPGLVSALAGFVEPGETVEEAVRREVLEETGLNVTGLRYQASQPWPFPTSLMLGFRADVGNEPLAFDREELEDARWFRRDEIARFRSLGLRLPFRGTIARALVEAWLAED